MSVNEKFKRFTSMCYADQAKAFLNAYWNDVEGSAEEVWNWTHKFIELDLDKGKEGSDVDEFNAHRFLESLGETMTVKAMRKTIQDADLDFNRRMALIEYCVWKFNKPIREFVERPQGDKESLRQAEEMLAVVTKLVDEAKAKAAEAKARAEEAKAKAAEAKASEDEAKAKAAEAKAREDEANEAAAPFRAAEAELAASLKALQEQEDAYNSKIEMLKKKSEEGGVVSRGRAKADLAQLQAEDPLPLRQAKITTEAARKRADKAKEPFEVAHAKAVEARQQADDAAARAEADRKEAEAAAQQADEARQQADDAVEEAQAKFAEAEKKFQELKDAGAGAGVIWWMEREVTEMKKYMPLGKGGIQRK